MNILDVMDGNILNKVPLDQINMEIDASTEILAETIKICVWMPICTTKEIIFTLFMFHFNPNCFIVSIILA